MAKTREWNDVPGVVDHDATRDAIRKATGDEQERAEGAR
jgi:hypothetical protein